MVSEGLEIKYAQPKQSRARGSMTSEREEICEAYLVKARHEINNLVGRGVVMDGNAFSSVLLIKGDFENSKGAQAEKSSEHQHCFQMLRARRCTRRFKRLVMRRKIGWFFPRCAQTGAISKTAS